MKNRPRHRTRPDQLPIDNPDLHAQARDRKLEKRRRGMVVENRSVFAIQNEIVKRMKRGREPKP